MEQKIDIEAIEKLVRELKNNNETISIMESCTGGGIADAITSISGASDVFEFGAVTYSNRAKIELGGEKMKNIIDLKSVYSKEVAETMAQTIAELANSTYGIGVTGQLGRVDPNNILKQKDINQVDFSIYCSIENLYYTEHLYLDNIERKANKTIIINKIIYKLLKIIKSQ